MHCEGNTQIRDSLDENEMSGNSCERKTIIITFLDLIISIKTDT